jgi:hypothetical protein
LSARAATASSSSAATGRADRNRFYESHFRPETLRTSFYQIFPLIFD